MKTVKDVSRISGVSVRTLHHYDAIGLLPPAQVTEAGYRLYDDAALQSFISENYYTCTKQILRSLGMMYAGGGEMTENIDRAGGEGTGTFAHQAIEVYCK